jgi:hypothetical protein
MISVASTVRFRAIRSNISTVSSHGRDETGTTYRGDKPRSIADAVEVEDRCHRHGATASSS